jgi:PIN domain nuclease of toxin-antitoxin system
MRLLVDTHILVWAVASPNRIRPAVAQALTAVSNQAYVSAISLWEISIKAGIGKLDLGGTSPDELLSVALASGFTPLPVAVETCAGSWRLPRRHGDPFDRLLVWQAIETGMTLVSADTAIEAYVQDGLDLLVN